VKIAKRPLQHGFAMLGIVMVVATITVVGVVAFRFLDATDNTEVATQTTQPEAVQVAAIETPEDVEKVTNELDAAELDSLDAELDAEFDF